MKQTDFFFSAAIDLKDHSLSEQNMNAMYTVHAACSAINKPEKYGSSVHVILIDAIHQDYSSKFHRPALTYNAAKKTIEAGIKVDLKKVLESNFIQTVDIYEKVILQALDAIKDQVKNFNFEKLKFDLHEAIQQEIKVTD